MHILMLLHHLDNRGIAQAVADVARHVPEEGARVSLLATRVDASMREALEGMEVVVAPAPVNRTTFAIPGFLRELRRLEPDVIFSHHNGPNRATAVVRKLGRLAARHVTVEHIHYSARIPPPGARQGPQWLRDAATRRLYRYADLVSGVAPDIVDDLVDRFGLDPRRTAVLPAPGRDLRVIEQLAGERIDHPWYGRTGTRIICCVANVIPRKGQHLLIEALPRVRELVGDARLALVGRFDDPGYHDRLVALVGRLGLADQVAMVGYQPNPIAWIAGADVFALASFNEGCPRVLSEAMAASVPTVATDCRSGPSFILDGGRAGILVPTGDSTALAEGLARVLSDADLAARLTEAGRERAPRFTGSQIAQEYVAVAQRVVDAAGDST